MKYAIIHNSTVVDMVNLDKGIDPLSVFSPDLSPTLCDDDVMVGWIFANGKFAAPESFISLDDEKKTKISLLRSQCKMSITSGFYSSALGDVHKYPSDITAQLNLMGSVTDSLMQNENSDWTTPFWCEDSTGVWAFRPHTAAQIQKAGADAKAHIVRCQSTLDELTAAINSAKTIKAVDAVAWPIFTA